ncbi:hypothetical protein BC332_24992 [Capsicum chinense]|nr:hypothetical protein BC332_24992 [Capsicum chinense]
MGISCNLFFAFVVFFLLHRYAILAIGPNISTDEAALLALKSHISPYRNNILASNWSSSSSVCSWIGITCSSRHRRVTSLDISNMQLHGTIPPDVGNLSFLVSLDIRNNTFHGELPKELAHLRRLKMIDCSRNNFTRVIPSFLSLLPNLRFLQLSRNQFFGGIPSSLSNLTKLEELKMSKNFLQGEIPQEFGHFRYMTILDLQFNRLTGPIPPSIFNIKTMQIIALTGNNLTGKLPETICDHLPNLEGLHIANNNLHGSIPPKVEKCRKLEVLALSINEFTGTVPRELGNITGLAAIYLGYLHLEGEIPVELGNLMELETIELDSNEFTGSVPASIFNLTALESLGLVQNKLSGTLPSYLGRGTPNLKVFYCGFNNLSGSISPTISNSSRLSILDLSSNSFAGQIPESLGYVLLQHFQVPLKLLLCAEFREGPDDKDILYIRNLSRIFVKDCFQVELDRVKEDFVKSVRVWRHLQKIDITNEVDTSTLDSESALPPEHSYWEKKEISDCFTHNLRFVTIRRFTGHVCEIRLINHVIKNAAVLKKLVIHCSNSISTQGAAATMGLLLVPRASIDVSIVLMNTPLRRSCY